jgi:hypothetical protein
MQPIDISKVQKLELPASAIRKLTPQETARFQQILDLAHNPPKPTAAQIEANKPYARIWENGQVVGEVYKGGSAMTVSNAVGSQLQDFFAKTDDRDARAQAIAKATGGTIRYV